MGELLPTTHECEETIMSCYAIFLLRRKSKKEDANQFRKWMWSDVVRVMRRTANDAEQEKKKADLAVRVVEHIRATYPDAMVLVHRPLAENVDEELHDFSTNRNPKYWLKKFSKTALMKECDKRGVLIDNPKTTLNADVVNALVTADAESK